MPTGETSGLGTSQRRRSEQQDGLRDISHEIIGYKGMLPPNYWFNRVTHTLVPKHSIRVATKITIVRYILLLIQRLVNISHVYKRDTEIRGSHLCQGSQRSYVVAKFWNNIVLNSNCWLRVLRGDGHHQVSRHTDTVTLWQLVSRNPWLVGFVTIYYGIYFNDLNLSRVLSHVLTVYYSLV